MATVFLKPNQFLFRGQPWVTTLFSVVILCALTSIILFIMFFASLETAHVLTGTPPKKQTVYALASIHKTYLVLGLVLGVVEMVLLSIVLVDYFRIFGTHGVYKTVPFLTITTMMGVALVVVVVDFVFLFHAYNQCPKGSFLNLVSQTCEEGCNTDSDCPRGNQCINGVCCDTTTHHPCNDGTCCSQPCQTLGNGKTFCCDNVCTAKDGTKECCGLGTVCADGVGCVSTCGSKTCDSNQYCYEIPHVSPADASHFNLSETFNYDASGNTVYNCLPLPSECSAEQTLQAVPAGIDNFYACFNANGLEESLYPQMLMAEGASSFQGVGNQIMGSENNRGYSGFFCGGAPQERGVQTSFKNCGDTGRCMTEATTDTIGMGAVVDASGTLYCNQLINCNNVVGSNASSATTALSTYSQTGIVSDGSLRTAHTIINNVRPSWTPPPSTTSLSGASSDSINVYQASCGAFPDITDTWGPCNGTMMAGNTNYQCQTNGTTGGIRAYVAPQYQIVLTTENDWNTATIQQAPGGCQPGQINCFGASEYDSLTGSPFNPAKGAVYINAGDAWGVDVFFQNQFVPTMTSNNTSPIYLIAQPESTTPPTPTDPLLFLKKNNPDDRSTLLDGDQVYILLQDTPVNDQFMVFGEQGNSYPTFDSSHGACTTTKDGTCCSVGGFSTSSANNWYTIRFVTSNTNDWANAYYGRDQPQPLSITTPFYLELGYGGNNKYLTFDTTYGFFITDTHDPTTTSIIFQGDPLFRVIPCAKDTS